MSNVATRPQNPAPQVETFNNKLCSDLLLVLQPVNDDGTNLSAKAQPSLWTSYLYPAAAFILQLYLAFLLRLAHTAWSWFGAPAQSYVNALLQAGMRLLRLGPGALKQAPAPSVHVSSAILASSSQKLADILLPRMAQAAAKDPVAGEGQRAPLQLTLRIPSSQLASLPAWTLPQLPGPGASHRPPAGPQHASSGAGADALLRWDRPALQRRRRHPLAATTGGGDGLRVQALPAVPRGRHLQAVLVHLLAVRGRTRSLGARPVKAHPQVATENTVALAVISWIQAGYQRILPSVKSDAAAWAASLHQHEQHSLVLLSEVRYPYLTSSYLVHILPVLTEGLGSALQAALAQHTQEAYTFNSSSPEKKCALAGEVHHSRFLPRLMYLQPPHDQLRLHLSMDLQRLSKTWLPAVSAVSPYLRALLLSTPACHTSSEDKYYNGFYWRLSVAADEFVGLSWCVLLRGNEVPLPGDTPKVMVCASVCAPGGPGTTTHPRPSGSEPATRTPKPHPPHTHVLRHEVPVSTVVPQHPYSAGAASPDAVRTPGAPPSPAPAVSASIAPAGAEDADLVTPGSTSTAASPLARPAGGASTQTGALGPGSVQPGALSHPPHVHPLAKTPSGPGESLRHGGGFGPHADAVGHGMEVGGGGGSQGWMGLLAKLGDSLGVNMRSGEHSGASVTLQCTLHSCD
ncbi:MAG: hypothetical protein WDW38_001621 [Sanguina aurantia]